MKKSYLIALLLASSCAAGESTSDENGQEVGASLNDKTEVAIGDTPPAVLETARALRPDIAFTAVEKEVRNGRIYYDVEGTNEAGQEIELDIMQDGDAWVVVEIQRDIEFDETPSLVRDVLAENAPGVAPERIIESDQGDGVIIYEFFDRTADGVENKYEVKYDGETAVFLTEEWVH